MSYYQSTMATNTSAASNVYNESECKHRLIATIRPNRNQNDLRHQHLKYTKSFSDILEASKSLTFPATTQPILPTMSLDLSNSLKYMRKRGRDWEVEAALEHSIVGLTSCVLSQYFETVQCV
jgi:hypothetical protein